jgi:hypothetical protein
MGVSATLLDKPVNHRLVLASSRNNGMNVLSLRELGKHVLSASFALHGMA